MSSSTSDLSFRQKARAYWEVVTYSPVMVGFVLFFSLIAALLEGLGLSFILPVIELVEAGQGAVEAEEGLMAWFIAAYRFAGVPLSLGTVILGVIGVMFLRFSSSFLFNYLSRILMYDYKSHLQETAYSEALDAPVSYFDRRGSDEILNTVITQASRVEDVMRWSLKVLELSLLSMVYVGLAFFIAPRLMLITGLVLVGFTYLSRTVLETGESIGDRVADANEAIQRIAQAGLQGIREVKVYNRKDSYRNRFKQAVKNYFTNMVKYKRNNEIIRNFYHFLIIAAIFGLVYVALSWTQLSLGALGVFLVALFRLAPKLSAMQGSWYSVAADLPHLIRTQQFVEDFQPLNRSDRTGTLSEPVTEVRFDEVDFSYGNEHVLDDVSFVLREHQTIAFVGPTGVGKSTIAELLSGFYPDYSGHILINGVELKSLDLEDWWSKLSIVRQDPHIFNDTLRNNLLVANPKATDSTVQSVVERALIEEFLDELEDGLDTLVGDRGVRLSGGQRQRVAVGRAILRDAELLILDEATSALDYQTEQILYDNLEPYLAERNVLLIAHRLSTVQNADRIYYLERGRIKESGTHDELIRQGGAYQSLYQSHRETSEPEPTVR